MKSYISKSERKSANYMRQKAMNFRKQHYSGKRCPLCRRALLYFCGRYGPYLKCSNCDYSYNITIYTDEKCEKCGSTLVVKWGKFGKFLACSNSKNCKYTKSC